MKYVLKFTLTMTMMQAAVRTQDERLIDILSYVEDELQLDTWSVLLWSKAVTTTMDDNAPLLSPKCHVVALKRLSDRPLRFDFVLCN